MNKSPVIPINALAYSLLLQLTVRLVISQLSVFISDTITLMLCVTMIDILSFVLPAVFFFRISGFCPGSVISFKINLPQHPFFSACAVLSVITAAGYISDKFFLLLENWGPVLRQNNNFIKNAPVSYYIILFLTTVPLAAITEEIFYRGIVLNSLARYNRIFALITQSVLFGLLHANPNQFLYAACGGFILGILTLECGSVFFAVIVHMANNALAFLTFYSDRFNSAQTAAVALIFTSGIIGLILLVRRMKNKSNQPYPSDKLVRIFIMSPPMITYFLIKIVLLPGWFE